MSSILCAQWMIDNTTCDPYFIQRPIIKHVLFTVVLSLNISESLNLNSVALFSDPVLVLTVPFQM